MKNKIYRFPAILIAVFFLSVATFAQSSDAVFTKIEKHYTLHPDGRMQYREIKELTLNTHYAFNRRYGETFIIFNPENQKLSIDEAYTIMADGKKVFAPENAFNAVLPRGAADFPHAANLREMVVTHTALEVGATIYLNYVINTKANFFPALMDKIIIAENDPVKELKIVVRVPEGTPFNYHVTKLRTGPAISNDMGFTTYTFTFMAVKPYSHDLWQKAENTGYPVLTFSTSKDMHRLVDKFVNQKAFWLKSSPDMIKALAEATEEAKSEMEKIAAIQALVANEIHHFGINEKHLGYKLRTLEEVWVTNGGTKAENALLLATLLRDGDINANPVALFAPGTPDRKAGNLSEITDYLVLVKTKDGEKIYLTPEHVNSTNAALNYPGYRILALDPAVESLRFETLPTPETKRTMDLQIDFRPEKSKIKGDVSFSGKGIPLFKTEDTTSHIREIMSLSLKAHDVTSFKITASQSNISFDMEKENPVESKNGYYIFTLPYLGDDPVNTRPSELVTERTSDIDLQNAVNLSYTFDITVPDGYTFVMPAENIIRKNSIGGVEISFALSGDKLSIKKMFRIPEPVMEEQKWSEVKDLFDLWRTKTYNTLIIKAE